MTKPQTIEQALAEALESEKCVRGVSNRYGKFNEVYWEQFAVALLSTPSMQAIARVVEAAVAWRTAERHLALLNDSDDAAFRDAMTDTIDAHNALRDAITVYEEARK